MKLSWPLLLSGLAVVVSGVLAWADPFDRAESGAVMVSNRSAARRLFPGLGELSPGGANFEFQTPEGARIRLQPSPDGGHVVLEGERLLGPADPEAVDGIWASLRMATTLRAVSPGSDIGKGQGGVVRVGLGDQTLVLSLGRSAPDKSGLYGVLEHEGDEAWVVEEELAWLVSQPAEAWLSHRLAEVEVEALRGLTWGESLAIRLGDDGLWRSEGEPVTLLGTQAVELRLDRLFNSRLEPMVDREEVEFSARPWLLVNLAGGSARTFALGGACPEHPDRVLVDRGPGMLGCIEVELVEPWKIEDPGAPLVESKFLPLRFAELLAVHLEQPERRTLRRRTGGWLLDEEGRTVEVIDDEAFRWFSTLSAARVDLEAGTRPRADLSALQGRVSLSFETGPERRLRFECGRDAKRRLWCARDSGLLRAIVGEPPRLAFDAETFEDRRIFRFSAADVRGLVLEGDGPRTSVRRDLGAWRLDQPAHPDGDAALDELRVEAYLSTLATLRAEAWADAPTGEPLRKVSFELAPADGAPSELSLEVYANCRARAEGKRPLLLSPHACRALAGDLLYDDPLRNWLRESEGLQIRPAGQAEAMPWVLTRSPEGWAPVNEAALPPEAVTTLEALLARWDSLRSVDLRSGVRPGPAQWRIDFEGEHRAPARVEIGADWAALVGADWWYALAPVEEGSASGPPSIPDLDPSAEGDEGDPGADEEP